MHPTVLGMEYGRANPRHRVVGAAWQQAHEWVRHNLGRIVEVYQLYDDINLTVDLNLPSECFDENDVPLVEEAGWLEEFKNLGTARHAFPRTTYARPSFERDPTGRQHLTCMSDGDHSMWKQVREGLGEGNTGALHVDACSFHLWQNLESMVDRDIRRYQVLRKQNPMAWDIKHVGGRYLDETLKPSFQLLFGDWIDVSMQHDKASVANLAWNLAMNEATLMGLGPSAEMWNRYHHPFSGKQGRFGRATHTFQCGTDSPPSNHPLATVVEGVMYLQNKGDAPSAASLESRINKRIKTECGASLQMGPLLEALARACKGLSQDSAHLGFSLLPDFFGKCSSLSSRKSVGRTGRLKTRKDFRHMFLMGIQDAHSPACEGHYSREGDGRGRDAKYVVASTVTLDLIEKTLDYRGDTDRKKETAKLLKDLRSCWDAFIKDPGGYVESLRQDALNWDLAQVKRHFLTETIPGGKWRASKWQLAQIVKNDVLYLSEAFHVVQPRACLDTADSRRVMGETWRRILEDATTDLWDVDIRFFECLHCNQCSKSQFCRHVAAVLLLENIIPDVPRSFKSGGIVSQQYKAGVQTTTCRHGKSSVAGSPLKESASGRVGQRKNTFSSQARARGKRLVYAVPIT